MSTWGSMSQMQQDDFVFFQFIYYSGDQWSFFTELFDEAMQSGEYKDEQFLDWYGSVYEDPFAVVVDDWLVS